MPPPLIFGDPLGPHWSAERSASPSDAEEESEAVVGDLITFMWDYGVEVPLWDAQGLLPEEPEWLKEVLGLSDDLIAALTEWGREKCRLDDGVWAAMGAAERRRVDEAMESRATALVERLRAELAPRFRVAG